MGGFGSGRTAGDCKALVEETRFLSAAWVKAQAKALEKAQKQIAWTQNGHPAGTAMVRLIGEEVILSFRYQRGANSAWTSVDQPIELVRRRCHFGGERWLFACPHCKRVVDTVYINGAVGCRRCLKLAYQTENASVLDRARLKTRKIEERLGGNIAKRPKRMRHKTYSKLVKQYVQAQQAYETYFFEHAKKLETLEARLQGVLDALS